MARLKPDERREMERKLHDPRWRARLQRVQDIVRAEFEKFRDQAETLVIRAIVPRTPIKELPRVLMKIEAKRTEGQPHYSVGDLEDLIGVKVICPYPSDVKDMIKLLRDNAGFRVSPRSDEEARVEREAGYRGYHFSVQLAGPLLHHNEDLAGINCEVQIKTMLEEAWDAKTHDVTYRREEQVGRQLLREMKLISGELAVLDERTEHLKGLILERQRQEKQRKNAVVAVYLHELSPEQREIVSGIPSAPELLRCEFTAANVVQLVPAVQEYREQRNLTRHPCRLAAVVGLYATGRHMDVWAIDVSDDLIRQSPNDPRSYLTKGWVCWALDRLDDALEATQQAIERAEAQGELQVKTEAQNSFSYWVAEKAWAGAEVEPELVERAKGYIDAAIETAPDNPSHLDTKGFLLIAIASTRDEIQGGRDFTRIAREKAIGTPQDRLAKAFYERHETIALTRLSALE